MAKQWKQYEIELPLARDEKRESPKGKTGLIFCRKCNAVYYNKSWHHNLRHYKKLRENLLVKFSLCPACLILKNKQFEGEIIINNIPLRFYNELINLIRAFCQRAYQKDPMDRLIAITQTNTDKTRTNTDSRYKSVLSPFRSVSLRITTTENQLAVKLAKKIKEVFNKVKMKISYSSAPSDVVYIKMEFNNGQLSS